MQQAGTVENPYTYTGREFDAETGLYYYRARYYDPRIGRFLQQDPLRTRRDMNLYRYVKNNPIKFVDPSGLTPIPGYKYCGERDNPTMGRTKNELDDACGEHDACYDRLIPKGLKLPGDVFEFPSDPTLCKLKDDCDRTLCQAAKAFIPQTGYDWLVKLSVMDLFCNYHEYGEHGGPLY